MCGICGIVHLGERMAGGEWSCVAAMLHAMRHRGPDGNACLARGNVVMATNRLAIRHTHELQPPLLEYDGIVVACNGEIDNHRELRRMLAGRGHDGLPGTDVGVIAPLYLEQGPDFLEALRGAFALALWDTRRQRLVLARDRAGERHLLYTVAGHRVAFASEPAALTQAVEGPARPNPRALAHYLRSGYCAASSSAVGGLRKVQPGEAVVVDGSGVACRRYWTLPPFRAVASPSPQRTFDRLLRDAVERQSDVDVDYGVLLSGGVDSALVTALLRRARPARGLPAYCARFAEASFDEGEVARRVARELGCEFVPVTVMAEDFPRHLRALIATTGELIADPAWIPVSRVAERASHDVRMLFAGEGADELFGGYPTYLGARWAPHYARLPAWTRRLICGAVEAWPVTDKKVAVSFLLKRFVQVHSGGGIAQHVSWTASIAREWLRRLGVEPPEVQNQEGSTALLDTVQRYDFAHLLPEAYLAKADRGAMLHGMEIRTPFLDREVIEFASSLPVKARVRGLTTKPFLKRYALGYLPRSVVLRRKRGLSVPLSTWLRGPLHEWARSRLGSGALAQAGIDTSEALALLGEHERRREDHARAIWTLIVLSEWLEWLRKNDSARSTARSRDHETAPERRLERPDLVAAEFANEDNGSASP
ncbi:MAG TPA: asparagine synthase (glutamine-hydrolyzing) [Rhodanobacteraceae bacterium]|nr:asparagine synthase (glutamine-hydrolyzing) [Rhodanobacteraceae bacterium]